ncbi:MAG: hypoxanthine phosphoribosyltransferase [Phycisphaeraceae bacterium]
MKADPMQADVERVLIDRDTIAARVAALAEQIAADLRAETHAEETVEITLVPILTGSMIFVADLVRHLPLRMQIHIISVSSYPGTATESRGPSVEAALTRIPETLTGQHVLVIDDILDSGRTLRTVTDILQQRSPASLRTCVLLRKQRDTAMHCPVDYIAFDIPDRFVVGYGLDYNDYYRNLPEICTLRPEIVSSSKFQVPSSKLIGGSAAVSAT